MITDSVLTEERLVQHGTDGLMPKLGLLETPRYLALTTPGGVESVDRHRAWQATLDKDACFDQVFSEPPKT